MWHKNCMWKILIIKEIEHLPSILNFSINLIKPQNPTLIFNIETLCTQK